MATTSRYRLAPPQMPARRRRTSLAACKVRERMSHETCQGGSCVERNASTLRGSPAWRTWLRTIRDYASSDGATGAKEALQLAKAMEDEGCGFIGNLSAQNRSVGGCFHWTQPGWEFKTVEFFCPVTCECGWSTPSNASCPRPFGYDCGFISSFCIDVDDLHYCPDKNAEVVYRTVDFQVDFQAQNYSAWPLA